MDDDEFESKIETVVNEVVQSLCVEHLCPHMAWNTHGLRCRVGLPSTLEIQGFDHQSKRLPTRFFPSRLGTMKYGVK